MPLKHDTFRYCLASIRVILIQHYSNTKNKTRRGNHNLGRSLFLGTFFFLTASFSWYSTDMDWSTTNIKKRTFFFIIIDNLAFNCAFQHLVGFYQNLINPFFMCFSIYLILPSNIQTREPSFFTMTINLLFLITRNIKKRLQKFKMLWWKNIFKENRRASWDSLRSCIAYIYNCFSLFL